MIMTHKCPPGYEAKFAEFIRLCQETRAKGLKDVIIVAPWAIGDCYEEIIESLARLADAGLNLHIATRNG
jgi:cytosine/adenosine deaminase-related metal-dependent hydrolase